MTETDLKLIESKLGVVLPAEYRDFMLTYPQSLREAKLVGDEESASDSFLFNDLTMVIEHNKEMRKPGLLVTKSETSPWPDHYFIIGADCGGNCWCIKLGSESRGVWFFDHEEGVF
jgi:SMI1 / KNR4 family (SUKH-1)